jgi:hypothetical protein
MCHTVRGAKSHFVWERGIWIMKKAVAASLAAVLAAVVGCASNRTFAEAGGGQSKPAAAASAAVAVALSDVSAHWAADSIRQALQKGYVDGYEDGTFRPDNNITRAEFIKMLVVATGTKAGNKGSNWYDAYVNAVADLGVYHSDDDFPLDKAGEPLTRVEMAKLAVRFVSPDSRPKDAHLYDMSAMYKAVSLGIIQGLNGGELGLYEQTTRAQSVTIIERVLTVLGGGKLPVDKYAMGNAELVMKKTNMFVVAPEIFGYPQYVKWDPSNLFIESDDGDYKGVIDSLVAIDMADPNDPHRGLLGDIKELHWNNAFGPIEPLVKDYPDSYVIVLNMHNEVNKDPDKYVGSMPRPGIAGTASPDEQAFKNGVLNNIALIYKKRPGDIPNMYIMPKKGLYSYNGSLMLQIKVPTRESLPKAKVIFGLSVPHNFP